MKQAHRFVELSLLRRKGEAYNDSIVQRVSFHAEQKVYSEFLQELEASDGS